MTAPAREPLTEDEVRSLVDRGSQDRCAIEVIEGGPALVRGAAAVADGDGVEHPACRPVVGVCTCHLSQRAPWCDGTHKVAAARLRSG
ncbi:hypothetical protein ABIE44_001438 [Marmoricola sp. OAE513]|uniref:CDGSH iron-sulfur domain-containing protein n=1 Tax=Marmoricola sp. OAE513 TaxID=2817894 RepID=UPI001AEA2A4C